MKLDSILEPSYNLLEFGKNANESKLKSFKIEGTRFKPTFKRPPNI